MSGIFILDKIKNLLLEINEVHNILLDDHSKIELGPHIILLGFYRILYKGESWYNSLGYFHNNFDEQIKEWEILRNRTFFNCIDEIKKYFTYKKYLCCDYFEYDNNIINIIALKFNIIVKDDNFNDIINLIIEWSINEWYKIFNDNISELKVKIIFEIIYNEIKYHNNIKEMNCVKEDLFYTLIVMFSNLIKNYNLNDPLIKKLH